MRALTGKNWDLIGFYYRPGGRFLDEVNVLIYDVYTGRQITKGPTPLKSVKSDSTYSAYSMSRLINQSHESTFKSALSRLIRNNSGQPIPKVERDSMTRALRNVVPSILGLQDTLSMAGYLTVNQVLAAIDGEDYSTQKDKLSRNLINSPHFSSPIVHTIEHARKVNINTYKVELTILFEVVGELMIHDSNFAERALNMITTKNAPGIIDRQEDSPIPFKISLPDEEVDETPPPMEIPSMISQLVDCEDRLFEAMKSGNQRVIGGIILDINRIRETSNYRQVNYTPPVDPLDSARDPLDKMRIQIESILKDLKTQSPAVVNISTMIEQYNRLASIIGAYQIDDKQNIKTGSYGSMVVVGSQGLRPNQIKVSLRSGNTIILPSIGAEVGDLETEMIEEILIYLDSLPDVDKRFTTLKIILTRELSYRVNGGHSDASLDTSLVDEESTNNDQ